MSKDVDARGQSVVLDYVLALGVGFLLITGLVVTGSDFVSNQQERAQEAELRVIGQQVAAEVAATDRLAQAIDGDGNVRIEQTLPAEVGRSSYTIDVVAEEPVSLRMESTSSRAEVRVELVNETAVEGSKIRGGDIVVNRTDSGTLRVERGDPYA